uniref:Pectinesterase inhibitor domain-containing protein n=1 Tax=Oryza brachyantha TaxID=4533 RepID=J3MSA0_ORYBR
MTTMAMASSSSLRSATVPFLLLQLLFAAATAPAEATGGILLPSCKTVGGGSTYFDVQFCLDALGSVGAGADARSYQDLAAVAVGLLAANATSTSARIDGLLRGGVGIRKVDAATARCLRLSTVMGTDEEVLMDLIEWELSTRGACHGARGGGEVARRRAALGDEERRAGGRRTSLGDRERRSTDDAGRQGEERRRCATRRGEKACGGHRWATREEIDGQRRATRRVEAALDDEERRARVRCGCLRGGMTLSFLG